MCSLACFLLLTVGAPTVGAERHLARCRCRDCAQGKNGCARSRRAQSNLTPVLGSSGGVLTGVALVCSCYDQFFCNVVGRWANRIWSPNCLGQDLATWTLAVMYVPYGYCGDCTGGWRSGLRIRQWFGWCRVFARDGMESFDY